MDRALGYVRVSTQKQVQETDSLESQAARIRAYCVMANIDLVDVIIEPGISGKVRLHKREGGAQLNAALKDYKAKHVVAFKLDRLFRDAADALDQTREWDRAGVSMHLVDVGGQTINTGTAVGRMFLTMMAGFAELERNLIGERTTSALAFKKKALRVYSGNTPLGFLRTEDKRLIPDGSDTIQRIKLMRAEGQSLRKIAATLNAEGLTGSKGGVFYASSIKAILGNDIHP